MPAGIVLCNLILCYLCKLVCVISDWLADPHGSAGVGKAGLPQSQSSLRS